MKLFKSLETLKREFLDAARKAARTPSHDNILKARKAFDALPEAGKKQLLNSNIKLDFLKKD